jgi:hypothetical protein
MAKSGKIASSLPKPTEPLPFSVGLKTIATHLGLSVATISCVLTAAPAARSLPVGYLVQRLRVGVDEAVRDVMQHRPPQAHVESVVIRRGIYGKEVVLAGSCARILVTGHVVESGCETAVGQCVAATNTILLLNLVRL